MYERKQLQARLSLGLKEFFWMVLAFIGLAWIIPLNLGWFLYPVAAVVAIFSILVDILRGGRVFLGTLTMLVVGVLVLAPFYWIRITLTPWSL